MLHFYSDEHRNAFFRGRKAHNESMRRRVEERRRRLVGLISSGRYEAKTSYTLAEALGVGRTTLWEDLQALESSAGRCSHCGQLLPEVVDSAALERG